LSILFRANCKQCANIKVRHEYHISKSKGLPSAGNPFLLTVSNRLPGYLFDVSPIAHFAIDDAAGEALSSVALDVKLASHGQTQVMGARILRECGLGIEGEADHLPSGIAYGLRDVCWLCVAHKVVRALA